MTEKPRLKQSSLRMGLEIANAVVALAIETAQLRLQVQAPDLWPFTDLITVQGQAVDNGIKH
ncbi:hypothetical protein D3C75_1221390 [compost metagenome]